ncbi:hypothetical protein C0991_001632 [Blastosporella zonata]|nr:hypothetical protein C0991_001632 [Blastosporella zonata]
MKLVEELVVECTHRAEGCMHTCQRQLLPGHLAEECVYREVPCPKNKCTDMMRFIDSRWHVHNEEDKEEEEEEGQDPKVGYIPIEHKFDHDIVPQDTLQDQTPADVSSTDDSPSVEDGSDVSLRVAALTAQNIILRDRVDTLENMMLAFRREMKAVKHALGPWVQAPNAAPPRYYSTEMAVSAQPVAASTSTGTLATGVEYQRPAYGYQPPTFPPYGPPSLPSAESLAPYFPAEDELATRYQRPQQQQRMSSGVDSFEGYMATHALVAPLNLSTTLEGTLHGMRESVVGLAMNVEALGRQQDIALTNEARRMAEEVGSLRAGYNGLRMQMHGIMMERNAELTGRDGVENVNMGMNGQWMGPRFYGQAGSTTKL